MNFRIMTFNANNLYIRYKFGNTFPGDISKKSMISQATNGVGYLPAQIESAYSVWNDTQRKISAKAITDDFKSYPDILFLQEIESLIALRLFNKDFLNNHYKHALLIDSRDFRQIDVGVLTNLDITRIETHVDDPDPADAKEYIFSRDCLEVEFQIKNGNKDIVFTAFLNHFKSKFVDPKVKNKKNQMKEDNEKRKRQATKVKDIILSKYTKEQLKSQYFTVIGDFNETPGSDSVSPLFNTNFLYDPLQKLDKENRWTYYWRGHTVSHIDNILLSSALINKMVGEPRIERRGISYQRVLGNGKPGPKVIKLVDNDVTICETDFQFERFAEVNIKDYASDHCPVSVEFDLN
jgi:endonuclease/exonuclease/phosphatase family metal-dependent hydrolase